MATSPLIERFQCAGQAQVFAFFERLSSAERQALLAEAAEVDLDEIARLTRTLLAKNAAASVNLDGLAPAPYVPLPGHGGDASGWVRAKAAGEVALRAGRVAAFTVAGGQGTRLGYDGPKGTFPVTPVRQKPLFQVFAEKLRAAGVRYGRPLHWFIMTSHANHAATEAFFTEHKFFGLDPARVHLFRQGRMPAVDFAGKILLEAPGRIAMSPDGHGGSLRALDRSGALDLLKGEGIDTISYFQVDNPLVRCIDPAFLGWHLGSASEMSSKMVPKAYAEEKLGHFCTQRGRLVVIEYSDLPPAWQRELDPVTGRLRFVAGSIAIHILDREFVRRVATGENALPFHRADKKIQVVDAAGLPVKPDKPNGAKFEMFVFDALPFAKNPVVVETARADDFSPVKNAEGVDSPQTCRDDQLRQFARWLDAAGTAVETDASGRPRAVMEIAPAFGYDGETFAESWRKLPSRPAVSDGLYLE
ncbi:MAG TPA: UDPGP type 1 family protein [Opitutaceae bacterium]|jgi:UDP-N-acetylglucosamine/UDP-N-acetylgalactosamine diphosphorylase|nr:UDPGP type 1 family protein [Opitutaceae bacterium]